MTDDPPVARIAPPSILAEPAPAAVLAALPGSRAVGGAVRDALAGRPVADVDVAAPFPPEEIAARLTAAGLRVHETGLAHGTVTAVLAREPKSQPVEVTSLRRDVVTDGRHAVVEWTTDWREDAARRDFTMNALSLSAAGELWDYFGGRADLEAGRVRFVGDPATRLAEDHLRALRYFRFQARYGRGEPDPAAVAAIRGAVPSLSRLSVERIWMELKRLLAAPDPAEAVALMEETGVLPAVLGPATLGAAGVLRALAAIGAPPDPMLRFDALLTHGAAEAARRLKASGEEVARLVARYRAGHDILPIQPAIATGGPDDDALRRLLAEQPRDRLTDAAWLRQAVNRAWGWQGPEDSAWDRFRARLAESPLPVFPLQGRDALALGMKPGPEMGRLLAETRRWWLEGGCTADSAACRHRLAGMMKAIHTETLPKT
ncbi:CCA tRNA nucleotidyltransferase [Pararoseomonas indoligenes]|uniref:CCA tRNA nucleotidyltransferase n=1 Tax=Roseomonas indoligenes TaxID=2820811 RepID=A0A940MTE3_9PROT|nr:CCA tRNA nucleotidyltransferase [Pararoseomonas indoligenes]MBP0491348.1 CCA tRNA nucleotidyltransferase [Pararoseomonas indoligenes]